LPLALQTFGETQSATEEHGFEHFPDWLHLYGEQSVVSPPTPVIVWLPSQVAPETQLLVVVSHSLPGRQSAAVAHAVLQTPPAHSNAPHDDTGGSLQPPAPLQTPAACAPPSTQLAAPHTTTAPT
jgi:hypothetical protein